MKLLEKPQKDFQVESLNEEPLKELLEALLKNFLKGFLKKSPKEFRGSLKVFI